MNLNSNFAQQTPNSLPTECFTCALIDEQGREIPITEAMIQQACRALEQNNDASEPSQG